MPVYEQLPPWNKPFAEQVAFFRQKLNLPSERWDDIMRQAHDKAFIVAGAQGADLLLDLRMSLIKAIEQGTGIEAFRKDFREIVAKHGWTGWTGEESQARTAWRTKVIYQTNMATSYAAGRWQQLNDPELLKVMPYWQYVHDDSVIHPRLLHQSWNGLTLPHDHPFWLTHFGPNGWGCKCRVKAVTKAKFMQAVANGRGPASAPPPGSTEGIDDGFQYAPGSNIDMSLRQAVQDKLITYPPAISKALTVDVNKRINADEQIPDFVNRARTDGKVIEPLFLGFVEDPAKTSHLLGQDITGYMVTLPGSATRHVEKSHGRDGKTQRPPEPEDYQHLIQVLNDADGMRQGDTSRHNLQTLVTWKDIDGEVFNAVWEVLNGKKNRALALITFFIKR